MNLNAAFRFVASAVLISVLSQAAQANGPVVRDEKATQLGADHARLSIEMPTYRGDKELAPATFHIPREPVTSDIPGATVSANPQPVRRFIEKTPFYPVYLKVPKRADRFTLRFNNHHGAKHGVVVVAGGVNALINDGGDPKPVPTRLNDMVRMKYWGKGNRWSLPGESHHVVGFKDTRQTGVGQEFVLSKDESDSAGAQIGLPEEGQTIYIIVFDPKRPNPAPPRSKITPQLERYIGVGDDVAFWTTPDSTRYNNLAALVLALKVEAKQKPPVVVRGPGQSGFDALKPKTSVSVQQQD